MTKDNAYLPILMLKEGEETSVNDVPYSVDENQLKPKKRLQCVGNNTEMLPYRWRLNY